MTDTFLFDFDGTLIDTNAIIRYVMKKTVRDVLGREMDDREFFSVFGRITEDQMDILCADRAGELLAYYRRLYAENIDLMTKPFPGVGEALSALKAKGARTAVVSSKGTDGILHGLRKFGLSDHIDVIVGAYDVRRPKPDPECATTALERLGSTPERALVVGDSPYDILCATNAGIRSALVEWTIFPSYAFEGMEPSLRIARPGDLPGLFG
jgi:pyrophosphatase PpaX